MEPLNIPVLAPVSVKVKLSAVVSVSLLIVVVIVSAEPLFVLRSLSVTRKYNVLPEGKFYGAEYLHFGAMATNNFAINAHALEDGEDKIVAERIKAVLSP